MLLLGLCDAGKTLLFARVSAPFGRVLSSRPFMCKRLALLLVLLSPVQLLTGRYRDTQTSITDSSAVYRVSNDKVSRQLQRCTVLQVLDATGVLP